MHETFRPLHCEYCGTVVLMELLVPVAWNIDKAPDGRRVAPRTPIFYTRTTHRFEPADGVWHHHEGAEHDPRPLFGVVQVECPGCSHVHEYAHLSTEDTVWCPPSAEIEVPAARF